MASKQSTFGKYGALVLFGTPLLLASGFWVQKVNNGVPEPYMDEVFHVPQAQQYCSGDYMTWNPKLTTPPGLYGVSILLKSIVPESWWPGRQLSRDGRPKEDGEGAEVLEKTAAPIFDNNCHITELRNLGVLTLGAMFLLCWKIRSLLHPHQDSMSIAATAFNLCLFPPLFFLSGLYYTDVLSTFVVLLAYYVSLLRQRSNSSLSGVLVYVVGIAALLMRQTNIFWVAIFLGGLEWVQGCTQFAPAATAQDGIRKNGGVFEETSVLYHRYASGRLHNPTQSMAGLFDYVQSLLSIAISAFHHPVLLVSRLWPYIALLFSFAAFVFWNGSVVLGDKNNHVATIHFSQLLYLHAFCAFFSFPLYYPTSKRLVIDAMNGSLPPISTILTLILGTGVAVGIAHFNTIIHPFTLADNRHYMFYVFRYTILRHPLIKYILIPVYVIGAWLGLRALGRAPPPSAARPATSSFTPSNPHITTANAVSAGTAHANAVKAKLHQPPVEQKGPDTAFITVFLLTTVLSLVTTPLVEPRYFIMPWLIWRLHLAAYAAKEERVMFLSETVWFALVNMVTCAVFLYKPFTWPSEPGLQRFMW